MSFLKSLFGPKVPSKNDYLEAMIEMADEGDRTHIGQVANYNSYVEMNALPKPARYPAAVTPKGRYMARLSGALFMVLAYSRAQKSSEAGMEFMNMATGLALQPLHDTGEFSRAEAAELMPYLQATFRAIMSAMDAGPVLPGSISVEHLALINKFHEALAASIGPENYTNQVHEKFTITMAGNASMALNHARKWIY